MEYDPALYASSAPHYLRGRPPYSAELVGVLTRELGLDRTGVLLDVGCGPGVLTVQLAPAFDTAIGLDPEQRMLEEAARHAKETGAQNVRWVNAPAEAIAGLDLPRPRTVTFGQSFHWTDRLPVAEAVFDLLEPGGAVAMITHDIDARPAPIEPPAPPIPHDEIRTVVRRYLGDDPLAGRGRLPRTGERYEQTLARTRFGPPRLVHAPGRTDIRRTADDVVSGYLSMSYAAPDLFGADLSAFVADVHEVLRRASPDGIFWDWPGDTAILIATKPA